MCLSVIVKDLYEEALPHWGLFSHKEKIFIK